MPKMIATPLGCSKSLLLANCLGSLYDAVYDLVVQITIANKTSLEGGAHIIKLS